MARVLYDERRHGELPVLADALEEAGCTDANILRHCRADAGHMHGCWVLDALLGTPVIPEGDFAIARTITVEQTVERQVRHIRQTSCPGRFAVVTLRLEPYPGPAPVMFLNA